MEPKRIALKAIPTTNSIRTNGPMGKSGIGNVRHVVICAISPGKDNLDLLALQTGWAF